MHISFTFKNFEPSEHLRKYARRRMESWEDSSARIPLLMRR